MWKAPLGHTSPRESRTGKVASLSDVSDRLGARFDREARQALQEAASLCERADRLRADVSQLVAVSKAADDHVPAGRATIDQAVTVEQLVDLVREAAGLLGQATWYWAQTMNDDAGSSGPAATTP